MLACLWQGFNKYFLRVDRGHTKKKKVKGGSKGKDAGDINDSVLLAALMDNVSDSIYFKDRHRWLIWVSNKLVTDLGFKNASQIIGKTDEDLFGVEFGHKTAVDDLGVMESGKPIIGLVESRTVAEGKTNWTSTSKLPIHNKKGEVVGLLGITREINELKQVEQDLQYLATHDLLTSLPNRFLLFDAMEQGIRRAKRNKSLFALLYIDLDGFKTINDKHSHDIGDQLLKEVASRLTASVRDIDRVARIGGDEFAVMLEDIQNKDAALLVAEKVRLAVAKPFDFLPKGEGITASIGIGLFPGHGKNAATLLRAADNAMYAAKSTGNATAIYKQPTVPD